MISFIVFIFVSDKFFSMSLMPVKSKMILKEEKKEKENKAKKI